MNHLYIILLLWQILRSESAVISSVEILDRNVRADESGLTFDPNCDAGYKNKTPSHTMCLVDVGTEIPLTQAQKDEALKIHNDFRKNVSPIATNMQTMVWDDELAKIATKWAKQCRAAHDPAKSRKAISLQDSYVGQNMAAGQSDLNAVIKGWHGEVNNFKYGVGSINGKAILHYTQMVFHNTARVGCGKASCPNSQFKTFYMCNYAFGQGLAQFPYKNGTTSCSDCPNSCKDNQCDCNGKLCLNTGTLNVDTCTCSCPTIYTGDQCQTLQCTKTEKFWCTTSYSPPNCTQYTNIPIECHMMCGVCPYPCDGKKCENGGTLDVNTCKCSCKSPYAGSTCSEKNCTGTEKYWCNQFPVSDCTKYGNFPSDCNIMCGVCPKPCDGKKCENGGTLDMKTCKCSCKNPYTGSTCTEKICTEEDWCQEYYTSADCAKYSSIASNCQKMCGVC